MNFEIEAALPGAPAAIWQIFFDFNRIATLIPGCESVEEKVPLSLYSARMVQKIGPFRIDVPTDIKIVERDAEKHIALQASGRDRLTGTTLDVRLDVALEAPAAGGTRLLVRALMQIGGRLAALGYPVVKKKTEELFAEFERRLRAELEAA